MSSDPGRRPRPSVEDVLQRLDDWTVQQRAVTALLFAEADRLKGKTPDDDKRSTPRQPD